MTTPALSRRRFLGLAVAGAAGLALAGCASDERTVAAGPVGDPGAAKDFGGRTITMAAYAKSPAASMRFWQQFAPAGLTVDLITVTRAAEVVDGLNSGELDFGLLSPYESLIGHDAGTFTAKIVGMVSRQGYSLIAKKEKGISKAVQLTDTKVAVVPGTMQELLLAATLATALLTPGLDVTVVPLAAEDHVAAFDAGDVDAYLGLEPFCSESIVSGTGVRLAEATTTLAGDMDTALFAATKNVADADLLGAVSRMQRAAADLLSPQTKNDVAQWTDLLVNQFGNDGFVAAEAIKDVGAEWHFDQKRRSQFEGAAQLLLDQHLIAKLPNMDDLLLLAAQPTS